MLIIYIIIPITFYYNYQLDELWQFIGECKWWKYDQQVSFMNNFELVHTVDRRRFISMYG